MPQSGMMDLGAAFVGEMLKSLTDKHGQVDVRVNGLALTFKGTPVGVELNGSITMTVHMRDLSDEEKKAHKSANLSAIRKTGQ